MDSNEEIERRVTAVESEVRLVRREVAAARALAAGADRDVADYRAEMRAHTRGLEALRQTQIEHYAEHKADMAELRGDFAELKGDFAEIRGDFAELKGDFAELKGDFAEIKGDFAEIKGDFAEIRGDFAETRGDSAELKKGIRHIVHLLEGAGSGQREG